jgi:MFS family permease
LSRVTVVEEPKQKQKTSFLNGNVSALALSGAIKALGGFVGVYLPLYFVQIGGNPATLGMLTFWASLVQLLFLSVGGMIADNYGRRKIIVLAALSSVVFPALYAVVQDWRVFGLLTVFAAIGAISSPATRATVADSIAPERRTTGIAVLQVVSTLPSVISPSVGGWLMLQYGLENGFRIGCVYAAVFAIVSMVPLFVLLKETLQSRNVENKGSLFRSDVFGFLKPSLSGLSQSLKALMVSYALVAFANGAVSQYYILYASRVVGVTALDWGVIVSLQLLLAGILKIPGGWLSDRFGKKRAMTVSLLMSIPMILVFTLSQSFLQLVVSALLLVAAGIYYAPAHEALQADLTPRSMRGRISAFWDQSSAVAVGFGALVGGFAFEALGAAVPFYLFALAELIAVILLVGMVKEPQVKEV